MGSERNLVVFPGDGIGPEIMKESLRVLDQVSQMVGVKFRMQFCDIGDAVRSSSGRAIPEEAMELFRRYRLALKGPVGESVGEFVRDMRMRFDLYANLRPVKSYSRISPPALRGDIDLVVVRENLEDIYVAKENESSPGEWRIEGVFTKRECERIARYSFELARSRRRKLAIAHKSNILPKSHGLFANVFREIAKSYPDVKFESYYADAMSAHIIRRPQEFDVIACPNFIGDILSDLAAEAGGGLGLAGSANVNPEEKRGLFEPIHGSAPDIAGKGTADPISQIRCVALLLQFLAKSEGEDYAFASRLIEGGIANYLGNSTGENLPFHLGGHLGTVAITDRIMNAIKEIAASSSHQTPGV